MENEIFMTEDGSHSLVSSIFGEAYHSRHGAIEESQHVFIGAGLKDQLARHISVLNILEIGFGSGLNALMTMDHFYSHKVATQINYDGIEAYPLPIKTVEKLNFCEIANLIEFKTDYLKIHQDKKHSFSNDLADFRVNLIEDTFEKYPYPSNHYNLIYFDAFAPNAQPKLWEEELMAKMYDCLKKQGVLVTYCAKGSFKRTLKSVGFSLESLPGPGKKREMTRARKI